MQSLIPLAEAIAKRLVARKETVAVAESSAGGLISAALLAVPGASRYFIGGAVVYTRASRAALLGITDADMSGLRSASEPYALLCARRMREKNGASWGLAETGAAGPTGNRYGDAPGHSCIARWWGLRSNARSRWRPAAATGRPICAPLLRERWSYFWKWWRSS